MSFVYEDRGYRTPCRIWQGATRGNGYGERSRGGDLVYVHREEWERVHGPIPEGCAVLHHCDQPPCAEVGHLFLGTQADNVADAIAKGRWRFPPRRVGETNGRARLTWLAVREIRASAEPTAVLAVRFGVSNGAIAHIRAGRTWREAA